MMKNICLNFMIDEIKNMDLFKRNCIAPTGLCGFGLLVFSTNVAPRWGLITVVDFIFCFEHYVKK